MLGFERNTRSQGAFKIFALFFLCNWVNYLQNRGIQLFPTQKLKMTTGFLIPLKALTLLNLREKIYLSAYELKSHFSNEDFYKFYFK